MCFYRIGQHYKLIPMYEGGAFMALVEDFYIRATRIKIYDDYCKDKTQEEIRAILNRISIKALDSLKSNEHDAG